MRLNRLDLNLLVALDALLTERSITRAAERIHLSQPATSGALARLREYFGDELLVRVGSEMKPTPLGESLANPVHNILMQIQATVERGVEFVPGEAERRFRFLLSDYTSTTLITHVVRKLADIAPGIQLEIFMPNNTPAEELEKGKVDFLIMPLHVLSQDHPLLELYEDDFVCLGCTENPSLAEPLTLDTYMSLGHVTVLFGSGRERSQDQIILQDKHGLDPRVEVVASSFNNIAQYLPGTNRIATVYRQLANYWCEFLPLKIMEMPMDLPAVKWGVQWHQYRDLDPGMQWMRKFIQEVVSETRRL